MLPVSDVLCSILSFILSNNFWSRSPVGFDAPSLPERVMVLVSTFRFFFSAAVPLGSQKHGFF